MSHSSKQEALCAHSAVQIAQSYGTPTFLYSKDIIEKRIGEVQCFDVVRYAQKACNNLALLKLMQKKGVVLDAVSAGEIYRAVQAGFKTGRDVSEVIYTADIFDIDAIELIKKHQLTVNVGSPDMITQLGEFAPGSKVILRINPGFGHGHSQKVNTGGKLSKHGIWHEDIPLCMQLSEEAGVHIIGLHMHIGSGSDFSHLSQVCDAMVKATEPLGAQVKVISAGGGLPIPYKSGEARIDVNKYFGLWNEARNTIQKKYGSEVELEIEPGRYLIAEAGTLLTQIRSIKTTDDTLFYIVDAGFNTLIRPAMYGAYHEISIVPADNSVPGSADKQVVVAGPLCESCDVFTQEGDGFVNKRALPEAAVGDFLLIHDAGAYGSAMSSNYNSKPLAPEVLLTKSETHLIRNRQTFEQMIELEQIPQILK